MRRAPLRRPFCFVRRLCAMTALKLQVAVSWKEVRRLLNFMGCYSWASSSAGRAPRSQRGGRGFESLLVHQHLLQAQQLTQPCEIRSVGRVGHFSDFCVLEAKIPDRCLTERCRNCVANQRHRPSRLYRHSKSGRRNQSAVSAEFFPSFTRRSFPTGIRDGGRREPREPQPCSHGERNVRRDLAAVGIPLHVQESPVRGSNEGALGCNE